MAIEKLFTEQEFGLGGVTPLEETPEGFIFEANLATLNKVNRNGRNYSISLMENAIAQAKPNLNRNAGRVEHPEVGNEVKFIPLTENAVRWLDLEVRGNVLWGKGLIIETESGKALKANIKAKMDVGFSTRGYGASERRKAPDGSFFEEMVSYRLETIDAVATPSSYGTGVITFAGESASNSTQEVKSKMNEGELIQKAAEARADKTIAENALKAVQTELDALKAQHKATNESLTAVQAENATLKAENVKLQESQRSNAVAAKLASLTSGDRFGEGIRTQVEALAAAFGQSVNESNVEALVKMVRPMVESAASAGNSDTSNTNNGGEARGSVGGNTQVNESAKQDQGNVSPQAALAAATYTK